MAAKKIGQKTQQEGRQYYQTENNAPSLQCSMQEGFPGRAARWMHRKAQQQNKDKLNSAETCKQTRAGCCRGKLKATVGCIAEHKDGSRHRQQC